MKTILFLLLMISASAEEAVYTIDPTGEPAKV